MSHGKRSPPTTDSMSPWGRLMAQKHASWLAATSYHASPKSTEITSAFTETTGCQHSIKTPQEIERIKKDICKIFRDNDLKITVEANLSRVNFLDVTLDLKSGKHSPYTKEGNVLLYVHKQSSHPPSILRNIPESINKRLSEISSDKECFDKAKSVYQDALNKSGYKYNLSYKAPTPEASRQRRNRQRNITWFNPPCSQNVETKGGKCFLQLIDLHFPKSNPLHKNLQPEHS